MLARPQSAPVGVVVERGWAAEGLEQSDERVELTLRRVSEEEPGRLALTLETHRAAKWRHKAIELAAHEVLQELDKAAA